MKLQEIRTAYANDSTTKYYENSIARFVFRPISFYVAYILIKLKFTPNVVTLLSIVVPLVLIPFLFIVEQQYFSFALILTTLVWVILDYVDGTMARALNKKSSKGHFFDLTGAYITFLWLFPLIGYSAYIDTKNVNFIIIGEAITCFNLYARLLNSKYLANFSDQETATQTIETGSLYERIDSLVSMRGLFIPFWIMASVFGLLHLFVLFYFVYYASVAIVLTIKLNL